MATASTTYTDLFSHDEVILDTLQAEYTTQLNALTSGVIMPISDSMASNTSGHTLASPMWDELDYTQATQILATSDALSPGVEGELTTLIPYINYQQSWGVDYLARAFASKDGLSEVVRQIARWGANITTYAGSQSAKGAFATALASTHEYTGVGSLKLQDAMNAKKLVGDKQSQLIVSLMHSYVHAQAVNEGVITTLAGSVGATELFREGALSRFAGTSVFENDVFAADASGIYPTYFARPGALIAHMKDVKPSSESVGFVNTLSAGNVRIQVEQARSLERGGTDAIIARISLAVGVQGTAWSSTANPTWTALATGSNWSKVTGWADKNIMITRSTNTISA